MTLPISYLNDLKANICLVKFNKIDGSVREMTCTLREDILPPAVATESTRKENLDVVSVWDITAAGWRSFRKENVIEFKVAA